jgi:hypothetical protein
MRFSKLFSALMLAGVAFYRSSQDRSDRLHRRRGRRTGQVQTGYREPTIPISTSNGSAIPPASSPPSCWPKKPTRRPTWCGAWRRPASSCWPIRAISSPMRPRAWKRWIKSTWTRPSPRSGSASAPGSPRSASTPSKPKKTSCLPTSWQDLTKPEFKGKVVMPNPNSSGTGFLDVSAWLQMWGEDKGWKYMDASAREHRPIHPLRFQALQDGRRRRSAGRHLLRLSRRAGKEQGRSRRVIAPSEGVGWDLESFAIVKGTKKLEAAKQLADWSVTRKANELYNEGYAVVAMPGVAKPVPNYPARHRRENDQERFRVGGQAPRGDSGRMGQALRRQVGAEEVAGTPLLLRPLSRRARGVDALTPAPLPPGRWEINQQVEYP